MSPAPGQGAQSSAEGSQLSTFRRIRLLYRKPRDAFALLSLEERKRDAVLVLLLCYAVRFPVILQRSYVKGHFNAEWVGGAALLIAIAAVGGLILLAARGFLMGYVLHLVVNVLLKARRPAAEALTIPFLSLAPQILLVLEFPMLVSSFREAETFQLFVLLRFVVTLLSIRCLFWGVRVMWSGKRAASVGVPVA
jgi:hypothetical protein